MAQPRCIITNSFVSLKQVPDKVGYYGADIDHILFYYKLDAFENLKNVIAVHLPVSFDETRLNDVTDSYLLCKWAGTYQVKDIALWVEDYYLPTHRHAMERVAKTDSHKNVGGRPRIGQPRAFRLTFPDEEWGFIDAMIGKERQFKSYAEYFRHLHMCARMNLLPFSAEVMKNG